MTLSFACLAGHAASDAASDYRENAMRLLDASMVQRGDHADKLAEASALIDAGIRVAVRTSDELEHARLLRARW
ncbi:MAG: hypothetical protein KDI19_15725, partial [Pseudomonadales bacterium]|nr:hypothetical protein [Pseudomonadales bacterium]